jgi:hypothetical protein
MLKVAFLHLGEKIQIKLTFLSSTKCCRRSTRTAIAGCWTVWQKRTQCECTGSDRCSPVQTDPLQIGTEPSSCNSRRVDNLHAWDFSETFMKPASVNCVVINAFELSCTMRVKKLQAANSVHQNGRQTYRPMYESTQSDSFTERMNVKFWRTVQRRVSLAKKNLITLMRSPEHQW